ncbi:MAG: hypothetical protein J7J06_00935 [Methanosarcinales archaeon]|nr:hypothetical protein [Methanosarcinales archaeon]
MPSSETTSTTQSTHHRGGTTTLETASAAGFGAALGILLDGGVAGGRYYQVGELSAGRVREIATSEQELLTELHCGMELR